LTCADVRDALAARAEADPAVLTRQQRQELWSAIALGRPPYEAASFRDRLKASELLGRAAGDFIERHQHEAGETLAGLIAAAWGTRA
jgi:hypothetical protein